MYKIEQLLGLSPAILLRVETSECDHGLVAISSVSVETPVVSNLVSLVSP